MIWRERLEVPSYLLAVVAASQSSSCDLQPHKLATLSLAPSPKFKPLFFEKKVSRPSSRYLLVPFPTNIATTRSFGSTWAYSYWVKRVLALPFLKQSQAKYWRRMISLLSWRVRRVSTTCKCNWIAISLLQLDVNLLITFRNAAWSWESLRSLTAQRLLSKR